MTGINYSQDGAASLAAKTGGHLRTVISRIGFTNSDTDDPHERKLIA